MADKREIGFARGRMSNAKSWELVTFTRGQTTLAHFKFAQKGTEHYQKADFRRLLTAERLVEFAEGDDFSGDAKPWKDEDGNVMWLVFILVADENGPGSRPMPALSPMSEYEP